MKISTCQNIDHGEVMQNKTARIKQFQKEDICLYSANLRSGPQLSFVKTIIPSSKNGQYVKPYDDFCNCKK
jgi:hypothetical protein